MPHLLGNLGFLGQIFQGEERNADGKEERKEVGRAPDHHPARGGTHTFPAQIKVCGPLLGVRLSVLFLDNSCEGREIKSDTLPKTL